MQTVIASNDSALALQVRVSLQGLGVESPELHALDQGLLSLVSARLQAGESLIVFFCSGNLGQPELDLLLRLNQVGGELLKVVVVGPKSSASALLQAVRCGAADFVSTDDGFQDDLYHALERVRSGSYRSVSGRLFGVMSASGGVGTSVLAVNLAASLAQRDGACGLLDLQLRGGDLAMLLSLTPRHTVSSLAAKEDDLDRTMFDHSLVKHDSGIHLLASKSVFSDSQPISNRVIRKAVDLARASYRCVVADLGHCEEPDRFHLFTGRDQLLIVLRLDFISLTRTRRLLDWAGKCGLASDRVVVIANRTGQAKELPSDLAAKALGLPVHFEVTDDGETVYSSINLGVPFVIASPKAKVSSHVGRVADSLLGRTPDRPTHAWTEKLLVPIKSAAASLRIMST